MPLPPFLQGVLQSVEEFNAQIGRSTGECLTHQVKRATKATSVMDGLTLVVPPGPRLAESGKKSHCRTANRGEFLLNHLCERYMVHLLFVVILCGSVGLYNEGRCVAAAFATVVRGVVIDTDGAAADASVVPSSLDRQPGLFRVVVSTNGVGETVDGEPDAATTGSGDVMIAVTDSAISVPTAVCVSVTMKRSSASGSRCVVNLTGNRFEAPLRIVLFHATRAESTAGDTPPSAPQGVPPLCTLTVSGNLFRGRRATRSNPAANWAMRAGGLNTSAVRITKLRISLTNTNFLSLRAVNLFDADGGNLASSSPTWAITSSPPYDPFFKNARQCFDGGMDIVAHQSRCVVQTSPTESEAWIDVAFPTTLLVSSMVIYGRTDATDQYVGAAIRLYGGGSDSVTPILTYTLLLGKSTPNGNMQSWDVAKAAAELPLHDVLVDLVDVGSFSDASNVAKAASLWADVCGGGSAGEGVRDVIARGRPAPFAFSEIDVNVTENGFRDSPAGVSLLRLTRWTPLESADAASSLLPTSVVTTNLLFATNVIDGAGSALGVAMLQVRELGSSGQMDGLSPMVLPDAANGDRQPSAATCAAVRGYRSVFAGNVVVQPTRRVEFLMPWLLTSFVHKTATRASCPSSSSADVSASTSSSTLKTMIMLNFHGWRAIDDPRGGAWAMYQAKEAVDAELVDPSNEIFWEGESDAAVGGLLRKAIADVAGPILTAAVSLVNHGGANMTTAFPLRSHLDGGNQVAVANGSATLAWVLLMNAGTGFTLQTKQPPATDPVVLIRELVAGDFAVHVSLSNSTNVTPLNLTIHRCTLGRFLGVRADDSMSLAKVSLHMSECVLLSNDAAPQRHGFSSHLRLFRLRIELRTSVDALSLVQIALIQAGVDIAPLVSASFSYSGTTTFTNHDIPNCLVGPPAESNTVVPYRCSVLHNGRIAFMEMTFNATLPLVDAIHITGRYGMPSQFAGAIITVYDMSLRQVQSFVLDGRFTPQILILRAPVPVVALFGVVAGVDDASREGPANFLLNVPLRSTRMNHVIIRCVPRAEDGLANQDAVRAAAVVGAGGVSVAHSTWTGCVAGLVLEGAVLSVTVGADTAVISRRSGSVSPTRSFAVLLQNVSLQNSSSPSSGNSVPVWRAFGAALIKIPNGVARGVATLSADGCECDACDALVDVEETNDCIDPFVGTLNGTCDFFTTPRLWSLSGNTMTVLQPAAIAPTPTTTASGQALMTMRLFDARKSLTLAASSGQAPVTTWLPWSILLLRNTVVIPPAVFSSGATTTTTLGLNGIAVHLSFAVLALPPIPPPSSSPEGRAGAAMKRWDVVESCNRWRRIGDASETAWLDVGVSVSISLAGRPSGNCTLEPARSDQVLPPTSATSPALSSLSNMIANDAPWGMILARAVVVRSNAADMLLTNASPTAFLQRCAACDAAIDCMMATGSSNATVVAATVVDMQMNAPCQCRCMNPPRGGKLEARWDPIQRRCTTDAEYTMMTRSITYRETSRSVTLISPHIVVTESSAPPPNLTAAPTSRQESNSPIPTNPKRPIRALLSSEAVLLLSRSHTSTLGRQAEGLFSPGPPRLATLQATGLSDRAAETVQATSVAASALAGAANVAAAGRASTAIRISTMATCASRVASASQPPDVSVIDLLPVSLAFLAAGEDAELANVMGGLVATVAVHMAIVAMALLAVYLAGPLTAHEHQKNTNNSRWWRSTVANGLVTLMAVFTTYYGSNVASFAVQVLSGEPHRRDVSGGAMRRTIAAVCLIWVFAVTLATLAIVALLARRHCMQRGDAGSASSRNEGHANQATHTVVANTGSDWDHDAGSLTLAPDRFKALLERFAQPFSEDTRDAGDVRVTIAASLDVLSSQVVAVISGILPSSPSGCTYLSTLALLVAAGNVMYIAALRPYRSNRSNFFSGLGAVLVCGLALATLVAVVTPVTSSAHRAAMQSLGWLQIAMSVLLCVSAVVEGYMLMMTKCRQRQDVANSVETCQNRAAGGNACAVPLLLEPQVPGLANPLTQPHV